MSRLIRRRGRGSRIGSVLILIAIGLVFLFGLTACAVDIGYLQASYAQMRTGSDAGALAGVGALLSDLMLMPAADQSERIQAARDAAVRYAESNRIGSIAPDVGPNPTNASQGDVVLGYLDANQPTGALDLAAPDRYNAATVRVRRTTGQNGPVQTIFGFVLGRGATDVVATSTAVAAANVVGFRPKPQHTVMVLPIAIDVRRWAEVRRGSGRDEFSSNYSHTAAICAPDGIAELQLFPIGAYGTTVGNYGLVYLGANTVSTRNLVRQIRDGINSDDLSNRAGQLIVRLGAPVELRGNTNVSDTIKAELAQVEGQTRVVLLYDRQSGSTTDARYTIVGFAGARVMKTEGIRALRDNITSIQPGVVVAESSVTGAGSQSFEVYTPPRLIQ